MTLIIEPPEWLEYLGKYRIEEQVSDGADVLLDKQVARLKFWFIVWIIEPREEFSVLLVSFFNFTPTYAVLTPYVGPVKIRLDFKSRTKKPSHLRKIIGTASLERLTILPEIMLDLRGIHSEPSFLISLNWDKYLRIDEGHSIKPTKTLPKFLPTPTL